MDKAKRIAAYMLAVCVAVGTFPLNALGEVGYSARIPFKVSDPKNVTDKDTVFTVKLNSVGKAPMPEVSRISAKANEEYIFGPIEFDEPGDYSYTISEITVNDDRIILDETVYEVDVSVFTEADGSMWGSTAVRMEGSGSKEEVPTFENDYGKIIPPADSSNSSSSSEDESSDTDSGESTPESENSDTADSSDSDSSGTDDSDSSEDESSESSLTDSSQDEDSSSSQPDSGGYVDTSSSEGDVIPPADDSSGTESTDSDISDGGGTSSGTDSPGTKTDESSKNGGGVGTLIDNLTSPDTGGKVAVTFSGLMIAGAVVAVVSGRRRSRQNSDNDDDGGGGSG